MTLRDRRPLYLTPLIERHEELAWLAEHIEHGDRLVTIFGPPGVGKTRLAVEALEAARTAGVDGYFCGLFEARTEEDVASEVLRSLYVGDVPSGTPRDAVVTTLAARGPTLVVLDSFEHLTTVALPTLKAWISGCTQTTFVITSREVLRVPGEVARELSPLRVPTSRSELATAPAARLLLQSVERYRPMTRITGEEEALFCDLVQRLDGLPLALEIVAPSIALLGTRLVHERLERVLSSRDRSLHDAMAWSWALLGDDERMTLAFCAVFQGGFSVDALEATAMTPNEPDASRVLPRLMTLRDKSLVYALPAQGQPRFGTYAAVAEFALEQLDAMGFRADAEHRHRAFFAASARRLAASASAETLAFMRAERANLMAAIERAIDANDASAREDVFAILSLFKLPLFVGERPARIMLLLQRAFATFGEGDDLATGQALLAKGQFILFNEDVDAGRRDLTRAVEIARAHGDKRLEAQALTHLQRANPDELVARVAGLERAVALAREVGDLATQSLALGRIAMAHCNAGATDEAIDAAREAVRCANDPVSEIRALIVSAYVNIARGDLPAAEAAARSALEGAARHGFNSMEADAFTARATVLHLAGKIDEADGAYRVAVARYEEVARGMSAANLRAFWAVLALERNDPRAALEMALRAEPVLDAVFDPMRPPALVRAVAALARARIHEVDVDARVFHAQVSAEAADVLALLSVVGEIDSERRAGPGERVARAHFEAIVAEGKASGRKSVERALLYGMIERVLHGSPVPVAATEEALVVQSRGDWFRMPHGAVVSCEQRQVARPLLRVLAEARRDRPGEVVSIDVLRQAGWPDERMGEESARNRLKQAIAVLRRLGLGDAIAPGRGGYMLVPSIPLRII